MQEDQIKKINRLHNRHYAKMIDKLEEIKAPQIIIDAVKQQFSFYTKDIKEQVLSKSKEQTYNDYRKQIR